MSSFDTSTRRIRMEPTGVCALVQDMLPFYLEGDVSTQSRAFIDDHLEQCDRCASFLAGGQSVQGHLRRATTMRGAAPPPHAPAQTMIARGRREMRGIVEAVVGVVVMLAVLFWLWSGVWRSDSTNAVSADIPPTAFPPTVVPVGGDAFSDTMPITPTPVPMRPTVEAPTATPVPFE